LISTLNDIRGLQITVMGLGLHGGGLASARFFAEHGARVTVTDLRDKATLAPTIEKLADLPIKFVLGKHAERNFTEADMVIKNPAVPRSSIYLQQASNIETDISVFLRLNRRPIIAVTGSKGKSTTVSALHQILKAADPKVLLGGNITVSPLTFIEECLSASNSPVLLELSSWQLADIDPIELLQAEIAAVTNIMADHQNRYSNMQEYVDDKARIYAGQSSAAASICFYDDPYGRFFAESTPGRALFYSAEPLPAELGEGAYLQNGIGYLRRGTQVQEIVPAEVSIAGIHNKLNLLVAATAAALWGTPIEVIKRQSATFSGIEHRMELVCELQGVRWYNDSAATIPDATAAALKSLSGRVHLIAGGTDKKLDFAPLNAAWDIPASIHLLEGSASVHMQAELQNRRISYYGPFANLKAAVTSAFEHAQAGDTVLFSPGATSFGMFLNEFDRGRCFKSLVAELPVSRA
jgi:UDP-N-acetylmuramoylalanine--D-glutamate ligase